ncbi:hypothetical protein O7599_05595 [Streptomyces sp. WMMC500]|uniref:hypothetical protein n=1 Tax=Streptomyces sp. WMMC500 TaxID=3015154 RepID=UPI00248C51D4|nr:hypothetical protein [Streptomyces sp. WMMC500]WBB62014.1 hypothetical protein O7599_05595 [Streptomyces sp. WMMC500]
MPPPPACRGKDAAQDAVGDGTASGWEEIVESFQDAAVWTVKELATSWMRVESPGLDQDAGPVGFLRDSTIWLTSWVAVLCLVVAAGRLAWERRAEPARLAAAGVLRLVVVSAVAVAVINLLVKAGDSFSIWIINRSTGCGDATDTQRCVDAFGERVLVLTAFSYGVDEPLLGLIFIMALVLTVAGIVQIAFMLARSAMLVILAGTLPLAAAASSTEAGRAWFQKLAAWLVAFILFEPAAAIVYAAGFASIGRGEDGDFTTQVTGVMLLILATLTLPALLRVAVPAVTAVGGRPTAVGARGVGQAIATGAIAVRTGGGSPASRRAVAPGGSGQPGVSGAGSTAGGRPRVSPGGGTGGGKPGGRAAGKGDAPAPSAWTSPHVPSQGLSPVRRQHQMGVIGNGSPRGDGGARAPGEREWGEADEIPGVPPDGGRGQGDEGGRRDHG